MKQSLRGIRALAVTLAIAALAPASARAGESEHLATARAALSDLKYEQALHALEKALFSGKNGPEEMQAIHRMLGEIHAALGQPERAALHFRTLLALDPAAELGRGVSPKIQQPFQTARAEMSGRGALVVDCQVDDAAQIVALAVSSDPTELVTGARVVYRLEDGREQILEVAGRGPYTLRVPATGRVTLLCAALDEHGNRLREIGSWDEPLALAPPVPEPQPAPVVTARPQAPPLYRRWWVWGTATLLAAGAGGYFAWETKQAEDELDRLNQDSPDHDFSEAEAIERRGRRNALVTNVSLGAAGVFALATVVSLVLAPDAPAERSTSPGAALAPLPLPQGAGVSVAFTF